MKLSGKTQADLDAIAAAEAEQAERDKALQKIKDRLALLAKASLGFIQIALPLLPQATRQAYLAQFDQTELDILKDAADRLLE